MSTLPPIRLVVAAATRDPHMTLSHRADARPKPWVVTMHHPGCARLVGHYATAQDACAAIAAAATDLGDAPHPQDARERAIRLWRGVLRHSQDVLNIAYARAALNRLEREKRVAAQAQESTP